MFADDLVMLSSTESSLRPGPAPQGAFRGCAPSNHCLCPPKRELCFPPSEDCATKKLTGSELLKCNAKSETSKILIIIPKFVEIRTFLEKKTRIHRNSRIFFFEMMTFFLFWSSPQISCKFTQFLR